MQRLLCWAALAAAVPVWLAAQESAIPRSGAQSGSVTSRVAGETVRFVAEQRFRPLVVGQDLLGGDLVQTGAIGVVGILFVDGTVIRLHPQTELLVKSVGVAAELELRRGTIWARTDRGRSDVTVTTPAAAAGIRGTDWVLSVEGGGLTRLTVYDGVVELANAQGAVLAAAGEAAVATPGRAPVKVGVANLREREQMLYTLSTSEAADLLISAAEDLGGTGDTAAALQTYRDGLSRLRRGDPSAAAALERAATGLRGERAAAARWLAAFARMEAGGTLRRPPSTNAAADAMGAAVLAAMTGDLDRAQVVLESVGAVPAALAAATQVAILRDDAARARRLAATLESRAPGSVAALSARASIAADVDGNQTEARRLLLRALRSAPDRAALWNALGMTEAELDHPLEAEAAYRRALALEPDNPTFMGNLAILLLDLERVAEARELAITILSRDPSSYLGLRALGRAALQSGDPDAETILRRALASQPAAAESSLALGIAAHMSGDPVRGDQELDAAARLDPNDPMVPLIRSITALDAHRVDDAIAAGRRAASLMIRQDGSGRVVAADRQSGSPLADAYTTIGLRGWARYTADRTYDPLSATSLFSEGYLNRLSVGRDGPSADGHDGSVVNGMILEPLAASYRLRHADILRRPFTDVGVTFDFGRQNGSAKLEFQGFARGRFPLAFSFNLSGFETRNQRPSDTLRTGDFLAGMQFGPGGGAFVSLVRNASHSVSRQPVTTLLSTLDDTLVTDDTAAVGGHIRLDNRGFVTLFAGHSRQRTDTTTRRFRFLPGSALQLDLRVRGDTRYKRFNIGYQAEDDTGFWTVGLEFAAVEDRNTTLLTVTDLLTGVTGSAGDATATEGESFRAFLGRRQRITPDLVVEGLLTFDKVAGQARTGGRLGLAWSPAPGHWLRGAVVVDGNPNASSLAPASVLGLVALRLPYRADGRMSGVLLRYDVELGDRVLVGLEHQRLRARNLIFGTADPALALIPDRADLAVTALRADWWVGRGIGVTAALTHADSRIGDGPFAGARLPATPELTAELGLGWLHPSGMGASLNAVWTGPQFSGVAGVDLPPVLTVDAALMFESADKRMAARLAVVNLFDTPVAQPWGLAPTRREVRFQLIARF